MLFVHHYLQKGFTLEYLNNVSYIDKLLMTASMELAQETERETWERLSVLF